MSRDLTRLVRALRIELAILNDRVAETVGLNPRDLDILDVIEQDGPCTPTYLAARTGIRAATLTGMLSRLEADRWISRARDPGDGRCAVVSSTARFSELYAGYAAADQRVHALDAALDADARATIAAFLADVSAIAKTTSDDLALTSRDPGIGR